MRSFKAKGSVGDGLRPILYKSAPQVAIFSARGPDIKDYSFQDADILKPDILAPGALIWAAWSPNGTDEVNYIGKEVSSSFLQKFVFLFLLLRVSFTITTFVMGVQNYKELLY